MTHSHTFTVDAKCRECSKRVGAILHETFEAGRKDGAKQAEERTRRLATLLRDYEYRSKNGYPATSAQSLAGQLHFALTGKFVDE